MSTYFQPHGRFTLACKSTYIRVQVCGSLNDKLIAELYYQIREKRPDLPRYWGLLILPLGENTIGTPDARQQSMKEMRQAHKLGCALWAVCPQSTLQSFRFQEFAEQLPFPVKQYDCVDQAVTWLTNELSRLNGVR